MCRLFGTKSSSIRDTNPQTVARLTFARGQPGRFGRISLAAPHADGALTVGVGRGYSRQLSVPRRARYFLDFIQARLEHSDRFAISVDKFDQRNLIKLAGEKQPKILAQGKRVLAIDFGALPRRFVLKVPHLSSERGIWPLEKQPGGRFLNLFSGESIDMTNILEEFGYLGIKGKKAGNPHVFVEEFFSNGSDRGPIPTDYKFYTFEGGVQLVVVIDRNGGKQMNLLGPSGTAISDRVAYLWKASACSSKVPDNFLEMKLAAERVRYATNLPFVSVDLYSDGATYRIGEITPGPGGPFYGETFRLTPKADLRFGRMIRQSYRRRGWPIPFIRMQPRAIVKQL